jgi:hypothetical protein
LLWRLGASEQGVRGVAVFLISRDPKQLSVTREERQCRYCYTLQQGGGRELRAAARFVPRTPAWGGFHAWRRYMNWNVRRARAREETGRK